MLFSYLLTFWKSFSSFIVVLALLNGCDQNIAQALYNTPPSEMPKTKIRIYEKNNSAHHLGQHKIKTVQKLSKDEIKKQFPALKIFQQNNGLPKEQTFDQIPGLIEYSSSLSESEKTRINSRFAAPPPPPLSKGIPRVGILLPLSGQHAALGNALLNAAQLALFHFRGNDIELLPQDTMGTVVGAADAAALVIGDGASLILGPLFSKSVLAVTPAAEARNVPIIAFTNDRRVANSNVFTMGFLPSEQVERIIKYAYNKGLRKFALLAPENDYGRIIESTLLDISSRLGAEFVSAGFFDPTDPNFDPNSVNATVVKKLANYDARRQTLLRERNKFSGRTDEFAIQTLNQIKNLQTYGDPPFDALLLASGGKQLEAISALLPFFDIDPQKIRILGIGLWESIANFSEPALIGSWFSAPPIKDRLDFIKNYEEMYGVGTPHRLSSLAYDATALATIILKPDGTFPRSEILAKQGFIGRDGIFRFKKSGYSEHGLSVYQVHRQGITVIDPAPEIFKKP